MDDTHNRLGEFLRARRALVTPDDVGLPTWAGAAWPACGARSSRCSPA